MAESSVSENTFTVDHSVFDVILQQYVDEQGRVDYAALKSEETLASYLDHLEGVPTSELATNEAVAYWINAYNAYTLKLIVDNFPVGSIREITPLRIKGLSLAIPKINSPFEYKIAHIDGEVFSLDDIEHGILRKRYEEPRIHFALVCASVSCPDLRREAYTGADLDHQLEEQARSFLTDTSKNVIKSVQQHALSLENISLVQGRFYKNRFEPAGISRPVFRG